ncbi:sugar transferase [uncultured Microbacterium sp.]|uniref:sugar transferase n=1 Tax=uncultured Microbacterium sp. TaxID=191216 RepID=UPI0028D488FB|nr:sugar transferase [uncultured Microbacterium sp.]
MATNLIRSARKPAAGPGVVRGGRVPGTPDVPRDPAFVGRSRRHAADWRARYARRLWVSDLAVLIVVAFGTQIAWFGLGSAQVSIREDSRLSAVSYWFFSSLLVIVWMWSLSLIDSRSDRAMGTGSAEYIRIFSVSLRLFGIIAILAFLLRVDVARGYLLIAFPLGMLLLLVERWLWRQWLVHKRARGEFSARVVLVGSESSVAQISDALRRTPSAGYLVVGACVPLAQPGGTVRGTDIPIVGSVLSISEALAAVQADTVAISSTDELPPSVVKRISWQLEAGRQHLVLAPSIIDVVGPRIQTRPVAGLPLIHVETPRYSKGQRLAKRGLDVLLATVGLIVLSPVFAVIAIGIRATTKGSVLFRQVRVGRDGREFRLLKFRTMVHNAEELLADLEPRRDAGNEVLFKMTADPRVTRFGRFLRRYSLDELPQLLNVLGGSMSLVGPRPSLPREVERYADHVHRRFMVKPGITGLWQISGRSSLSWEESVRLDLSYVENWTLIGDIVILFKTVKAALAPGNTAA